MGMQRDVVVIGAGSLGTAAAYHLQQRSLRVALVERHGAVEETTPRAAGMGMEIQADDALSRIGRLGIAKLMRFEAETGQRLVVHQPGSIKVARTEPDEAQLHDEVRRGQAMGVEVDYVQPAQARRLASWFDPGTARAMWYAAHDIYLEPGDLPRAYLAAFRAGGGDVLEHRIVTDVRRDGDAVAGVVTDQGPIEAPTVVLAAGAWNPVLADRAGVNVAMWPIRHELLITVPIQGVANTQPVVRVMDAKCYVRPIDGGLMFGAYEPDPLQLDLRSEPGDFRIERLPISPEPLQRRLDEVAMHFPRLVDAERRVLRGGLPTMTPDGHFLVGPLAVPGLWLIGGCNVGGLATSPALGQHLADWIATGEAPADVRPFDPGRFGDRYTDRETLRRACLATYVHKYSDEEIAVH